uniref:YopX family protein n=1 Tax=Latilactobacillus sakei TaxID=1599 RepID=UPI003F52EEFD
VVEIVFGDDDNYVAVENGQYIERWRFDDIELMQYTGLKDMNGVEIYEGDIVLRLDNPKEKPALVMYVIEGARFVIDRISFYQPIGEFRYEVIGNKFENPELLEAD